MFAAFFHCPLAAAESGAVRNGFEGLSFKADAGVGLNEFVLLILIPIFYLLLHRQSIIQER